MILTVTMNPSVDIAYPLDVLNINSVNRVARVEKEAGGKGLNVARVIKLAGRKVMATGISGGILGEYILSHLDRVDIKHEFFVIDRESRNCIAILHQGCQTEILEPGPQVSAEEQQRFLDHFDRLLTRASLVILSGSLPVGVANTYYGLLTERAQRQHKKVLLDCAGECLSSAITAPARPWLIKPNKQEIEQLTGKTLDCADIRSFIDLIEGHHDLKQIPWIIVSLGKFGAFARIAGRYYHAKIPQLSAVNPVGSGDATIAGLAIAINENSATEYALKQAMAFGMLNALQPQTGCIDMENFPQMMAQILIHEYREDARSLFH